MMARAVENSPFPESTLDTSSTSKVKKRTIPKKGEWVETFITAIMQGMSVLDATKEAGVHITLPYKRRVDNEDFRNAWREAAEIGTELMEQEAARRAYHGTLKPVFHKGQECGTIREYSDTLMIFLLKARKPVVYRDNAEKVNVAVVNNITGAVFDDIEQDIKLIAGPMDTTTDSSLPSNDTTQSMDETQSHPSTSQPEAD